MPPDPKRLASLMSKSEGGVMQIGLLPKINTEFAHRDPGITIVGAGSHAPDKYFRDAFEALRIL